MGAFDGMADIFAEVLGAEEGGATYEPPDRSAVIPCRPIVSSMPLRFRNEDVARAEFAGKPRVTGKIVSVRKSEVEAPATGGVFTIGDEAYTIVGDPVLDLPERAMWRCETA